MKEDCCEIEELLEKLREGLAKFDAKYRSLKNSTEKSKVDTDKVCPTCGRSYLTYFSIHKSAYYRP